MAGVQPPSTYVYGTDTLYIYRYSIIVILLWPKCNFYMVYHHHHALIPAIIYYDIYRTLIYISTQKISLKCINTTTMHLNNVSSSLDVDFSSFNKTFFRQTFIFHTRYTAVVSPFSIILTMSIDLYTLLLVVSLALCVVQNSILRTKSTFSTQQ